MLRLFSSCRSVVLLKIYKSLQNKNFKIFLLLFLIIVALWTLLVLLSRETSDEISQNKFYKLSQNSIQSGLQRNESGIKTGLKDWTNYTLLEIESRRIGPGEHGQPVSLNNDAYRIKAEKIIEQYSHNGLVSDLISLDRSLPEIRHANCLNISYDADLPSASIVIVFHNEYLSSLLRTVHSIINRTPRELLKEVILVDDNSDKEFLKQHLDDYFKNFHPELVRIIRLSQRVGLMQARIAGINASVSEIVVVMDAHIEVFPNWLPPLIQPVADDWRVLAEPVIVEINSLTYGIDNNEVIGDLEGFNMLLTTEWKPRRAVDKVWLNYENPTIIGAVSVFNKSLFWHVGGYDSLLEIYGGEQFDLSFKVWRCLDKGRIITVPCSIVGHNYKSLGHHPFYTLDKNYPYLNRNLNRIVYNFFNDFYKKVYFELRPDATEIDPGDLTMQLQLKEKLKCKSFDWYLENVYPEFLHKYPEQLRDKMAWGLIKMSASPNICINTLGRAAECSLYYCPDDSSQLSTTDAFTFLGNHEIRGGYRGWSCWDASQLSSEKPITIQQSDCDTNNAKNQYFSYDVDTLQIKSGDLCLDIDYRGSKYLQDAILIFTNCTSSSTQTWTWSNINPNYIDEMRKHTNFDKQRN